MLRPAEVLAYAARPQRRGFMAGAQSSFVWYELMTSDVAAAKAPYSQGAAFALVGSK